MNAKNPALKNPKKITNPTAPNKSQWKNRRWKMARINHTLSRRTVIA